MSVEHELLRKLCAVAQQLGCREVAFPCRERGRNKPVLSFLKKLATERTDSKIIEDLDRTDNIGASWFNRRHGWVKMRLRQHPIPFGNPDVIL
jgi:predicted enzyme involved in methoxymalonyl-ACP biosynthesis